jgi:nucleoid-associated protein YgaU
MFGAATLGLSFRSTVGKALIRSVALAAAALVVWSVAARPLGAHGPKTTYRVKAYDTLWTIAQAHYGGDVRDGVWQIQQANHLTGDAVVPGEKLVLP